MKKTNKNKKNQSQEVLTTLNQNQTKWEENHTKIFEAYYKLFKNVARSGKIPSLSEIANDSGVTRQTIAKHIQNLKLNELSPKHKLRVDKILNGLSRKAERGDVSAAKLYMQIVWGWTEKTQTDITTGNEPITTIRIREIVKK